MNELTVHRLHFLSDSLFELQLERGNIRFESGSCLALFNGGEESRPYSIAAGTGEKFLRFLIRRVPGGDVSDWLARRRPGDLVRSSEPFGWFRPGGSAEGERCAFVVTGTGIAPFLSYLRSSPMVAPEACFYGVRQWEDAFARDELLPLPGFKLALSREEAAGCHAGRVTDLLEGLPLAADIHYYLCGLDSMIDQAGSWLEEQGVDFAQIHREIFFYEDGSH